MASLGLHCIGKKPLFSVLDMDDQQFRLGFSHEVKSKHSKQQITQASLVANIIKRKAGNRLISLPIVFNQKEETGFIRKNKNINTKKVIEKEAISPEKLDEWMRNSVVEIVKNIGKAPLLVNVYTGEGMESSTIKMQLEREKTVAESWPLVKKSWEEYGPVPDGIILVEELKDEEDGMIAKREEPGMNEEHSTTRSWGVLIQGRGVNTAACYILKTCRVGSSLGFCTHFSLLKAKCFGEPAELQLRSSWLNGQ